MILAIKIIIIMDYLEPSEGNSDEKHKNSFNDSKNAINNSENNALD